MPPLGGPGVRRVNAGAVKRRERNIAKLPAPKRAAVYVPPAKAYKPVSAPAPRGDLAGDPQGYKRATKYRTSRPYYNAYHDVWRQNPAVKKASGQIAAGWRLRTMPREEGKPLVAGPVNPDKVRRGKALVRRGQANYETQQKRGPDTFATEAYGQYGKGLWKRAGKYYPRPKDQPRQQVDYKDPERKRATAWVYPNEHDVVHVAPETIRQFMYPKKGRGKSESVLLHEWAHTRQPPALKGKTNREGGAEAIEKRLSRRLGVTYAQPTPDYKRWRRRVEGKGGRYILHGQFGGKR